VKKKILDYHHTGLYVALENGYYKEEGLDVKIIEPAEGSTPVLVATGKGDLSFLLQREKHQDTKH